jgi:serine/threonine protein kinase
VELSGQSLVNPSEPQMDERSFGRYELLCHLATGGMAHIYVAQLPGSGEPSQLYAIKRIHDDYSEDEHFIQMFIDEALVASRIAHPNVVQVLELGHVEEVHFLAMEYVHGESLRALMRRARIPLTTSAYLMARVAAGLHAAHDLCDESGTPLDVVHRDVSPQNVLIGYDASVKVTDFGVARARDQIHVTQSGAIKGKYSYMSPEQTLARQLDRRSDVFSFGIVLYELTTGTRLFRCKTPSETLRAVRQQPITPPSEIVQQYPPGHERIVLKSLQRQRDKRHQTALELQNELDAYLEEAGCSHRAAMQDLQQLMHKVFAERMAKREGVLRAALESTDVMEAADAASERPRSSESGVGVLASEGA